MSRFEINIKEVFYIDESFEALFAKFQQPTNGELKEDLIEKLMDMTDCTLYSEHYVEPREGVMIYNQLIKNRSFCRERFSGAVITNTRCKNCTFLCVSTWCSTIFENCVFENCRFINCSMNDTYLENVAFIKCNIFDSCIESMGSKILSVWRIDCKTTYRQLKKYEELFF